MLQVQDLYADGHEMASHTVTHSFGTNFNEETWANEVVGEAEMLVRFGGINPADIKGMRAPFLAVGGDRMFNMLSRSVRLLAARPARGLSSPVRQTPPVCRTSSPSTAATPTTPSV